MANPHWQPQTANTAAGPIRSGQVYRLWYRCRDIVEEGTVECWWTGTIDLWGKLTICTEHDDGETMYLFPDEIIDLEPLG